MLQGLLFFKSVFNRGSYPAHTPGYYKLHHLMRRRIYCCNQVVIDDKQIAGKIVRMWKIHSGFSCFDMQTLKIFLGDKTQFVYA